MKKELKLCKIKEMQKKAKNSQKGITLEWTQKIRQKLDMIWWGWYNIKS